MTRLAAWRGWALTGAVVSFVVLAWLSRGPLDVGDFGTFDAPDDYFYGVDAAREYLQALTQDGSAARLYLGLHRWLDTLFPALISLWFIATIWNGAQRLRALLIAVPAIYFVIDMSENFGVAALIGAGRDAPAADILAVRLLTQAKMVSFVAAALVALWCRARHRRQTKGERA